MSYVETNILSQGVSKFSAILGKRLMFLGRSSLLASFKISLFRTPDHLSVVLGKWMDQQIMEQSG